MTDKAAIRELREKVEAGEVSSTDFAMVDLFRSEGRALNTFGNHALKAYFHQSFDAALALHEAVLPGWGYCIDAENSDPSVCVYGPDLEQVGLGNSKSPARAWLIAILRAMEND